MSRNLLRSLRSLLSTVGLSEASPRKFSVDNHPLPEADKWAWSEFIVRRLVPIVGVRPYPLDELLLMCSVINYFKPDIIIEWGTHYGVSARVFWEIVNYLHLNCSVHSIDLAPNVEHIENIKKQHERGALVKKLPVNLYLGDGLQVAKQLVLEKRPEHPLFFLDGDHAYATVASELKTLKAVTPHGIVLAHDTFYQEEISGYNVGPITALNEFTAQYKLPLHSTVLGLPGMSLTYW